jgi:hypothetical protein
VYVVVTGTDDVVDGGGGLPACAKPVADTSIGADQTRPTALAVVRTMSRRAIAEQYSCSLIDTP